MKRKRHSPEQIIRKLREADGWTCKKTCSDGDLYLFYFGSPEFVIAGVGVSDGGAYVEEGPFAWSEKSQERFCSFAPLVALDEPVERSQIESHSLLKKWWKGMPWKGRSKRIKDEFAAPLLEMIVREDRAVRDELTPYLNDLGTRGVASNRQDNSVARAIDDWRQPAVDKEEPPSRQSTNVLRVIRDTAAARRLKRNYEYACQICGDVIRVPAGMTPYYCEVHHLRPLGGVHRGLDDARNMLVVCPTCHAGLDLLAIAVHPQSLRIKTYASDHPHKGRRLKRRSGHRIDQRNLKYHYQLFRRVGATRGAAQ